jgi:hypothetical protein
MSGNVHVSSSRDLSAEEIRRKLASIEEAKKVRR